MADFAVTVTANTDPMEGFIAQGGDGRPAQESDFEHVRNWVRGMLHSIQGGLPAGWDIEIVTLSATSSQKPVDVDPSRPVLTVVTPERFTLVQMAECGSCGLTLRRDGEDAIWYHVPDCTDPRPLDVTEPDVLVGTAAEVAAPPVTP